MLTVDVQVTGVDAVVGRFETAMDRVRAQLRRAAQTLGIKLQRHVKADYLTGQALHVQSGRLRRGVNMSTEVTDDSVSITVGDNVAYARVHELGFSGTEDVRAHVRRTAKGTAQVRAHVRQANTPARPFLTPALEDLRAEIWSGLVEAVQEAI